MDAYLGLFISALLSATLLPGSSEILIASLSNQGFDHLTLWIWATLGNTLGSLINWLLGRYFLHFKKYRWFPVSEPDLQRAQKWFQRYGIWSLLLSWAPVIGDALTLLAGVMKTRLTSFLLLVAVAKGMRYAIILGLIDWIT